MYTQTRRMSMHAYLHAHKQTRRDERSDGRQKQTRAKTQIQTGAHLTSRRLRQFPAVSKNPLNARNTHGYTHTHTQRHVLTHIHFRVTHKQTSLHFSRCRMCLNATFARTRTRMRANTNTHESVGILSLTHAHKWIHRQADPNAHHIRFASMKFKAAVHGLRIMLMYSGTFH